MHIKLFDNYIYFMKSLNPASEDYLSRNWMKTSPGKSDFIQRGIRLENYQNGCCAFHTN